MYETTKFTPTTVDHVQVMAAWLTDKMHIMDMCIDFVQVVINCAF